MFYHLTYDPGILFWWGRGHRPQPVLAQVSVYSDAILLRLMLPLEAHFLSSFRENLEFGMIDGLQHVASLRPLDDN